MQLQVTIAMPPSCPAMARLTLACFCALGARSRIPAQKSAADFFADAAGISYYRRRRAGVCTSRFRGKISKRVVPTRALSFELAGIHLECARWNMDGVTGSTTSGGYPTRHPSARETRPFERAVLASDRRSTRSPAACR